MPNKFLFQDLVVYQRSLSFSIKACKIASDFPIKYSRIRDQIIGASTSIPLNIAEGSGRKSTKERINFYNISRSSVFECVPLFEICKSLELIGADDFADL
ncbi:MAG: four helix bundle protein, partial [Candidatus Pacebacteria bacterium]|nr:four helix bundle protein [Candidatus Paceibacterota bacterium]